jgi:hypothetical protein
MAPPGNIFCPARWLGWLAGWLDGIDQASPLVGRFFISCAIELYRMVKVYVKRSTVVFWLSS